MIQIGRSTIQDEKYVFLNSSKYLNFYIQIKRKGKKYAFTVI